MSLTLLDDDLFVSANAALSNCGTYRYWLRRQWSVLGKPTATFIMLNPSTADASEDDPTIRRCIGFAKAWGCQAVDVINLFAYRATDPRELRDAINPIGPENHEWVKRTLQANAEGDRWNPAGPVVCAWGTHGTFMRQNETMLGWLDAAGVEATALRVTKDGHPSHPLYLPKTLTPVAYLAPTSTEGGA